MKPCLFLLCSSGLMAATPCGSLGSLALPNTEIQFAEHAAAATMLGPGGFLVKTPAFCRVGGIITPVSDSEIHFEVWMPEAGWNGKFRATGNGGFAGSINYSEMAAALRDGYATASTDTGHRANGIDADWALGHPEKIRDFGFRAIHEMTVKAKGVIEAFYGDAPKRSYFASCSNGGRQALMEAQRFPDDYDGILAGAPANYWTHLLITNFYASGKPMLENPASYIPKEKIPAIAKAVLAACDAADGLKDGILSDPTACHFDPATIVCKGAADSDECLTPPQAASLQRIYEGARNGDGQVIFPGYEPGGEDGGGGWSGWITGAKPGLAAGVLFSEGFQRDMVFSNAGWTYKQTNLANALDAADTKMAGTLNSTDANLKAFQAHGGKLIIYHGWSDAAIPPRNAIGYYDDVAKAMGGGVDDFVRLYMLPGVQHCAGGPGANYFGQAGVLKAGDAQHDVFTALVDWVEQGSTPGAIVATKFVKDDPANGIEMTRPVCPWPRVAKYDGSGDGKRAGSFVCAAAH
jgi:hypothetical protein